MTSSNSQYLLAVTDWFRKHSVELAERDVVTRLIDPEVEPNQDSATIEFIASTHLVSATFWGSGASEVIVSEVAGSTDVVTLHEVTDDADVVAILDEVAGGLGGARSGS